MRISTDKADPGYRQWCILNADSKIASVFLDGVQQTHAVMADDETGEVRRYVETASGNLAVDLALGEFLQETVSGQVEIRIKDLD